MKKIIYIDMDDVLYDFSNAHKEGLTKNPEIVFIHNHNMDFGKNQNQKNTIETDQSLQQEQKLKFMSNKLISVFYKNIIL